MSDTVIIDGDIQLLENLDGDFDMSEDIDGDVELDNVVDGDGDTALLFGGSSDHRLLNHRDAIEQHPISAITNLQQELSVRPSSPLTNQDIQNILNM